MTARAPLLLLPGQLCTAEIWANQQESLAPIADCRVGDLTQEERVDALAARLLATVPWPVFSVAGHSMGGIVAMEMVRQAPNRVERLALIATNHRAEAPERQALRASQIDEAGLIGIGTYARAKLAPLYGAKNRPLSLRDVDLIARMAETLGQTVFRRQSLALRDRPDQADVLTRFVGPALLLCGSDDQLCPVSRHTDMADLLQQATLRILPGVGHFPMLEMPEAVSDALTTWLSGPF